MYKYGRNEGKEKYKNTYPLIHSMVYSFIKKSYVPVLCNYNRNKSCFLLNVNLIKTNRSIFISCLLISTDPQLNIVSSGSVTIVSVKPW